MPKVNDRIKTIAVIDHAWRIPMMIQDSTPGPLDRELDGILGRIMADVKFLLSCPAYHLNNLTPEDKTAVADLQEIWLKKARWVNRTKNIQTFIQATMAIIDDHLATGAVKYRPAQTRFASLIYNFDALLAYYRRTERHHPACVRAGGRAADIWKGVVSSATAVALTVASAAVIHAADVELSIKVDGKEPPVVHAYIAIDDGDPDTPPAAPVPFNGDIPETGRHTIYIYTMTGEATLNPVEQAVYQLQRATGARQ